MVNNGQSAWMNEMLRDLGEYVRVYPGCSPQDLAGRLEKKFLLAEEDAAKLAGLVKKELDLAKLGLAAIELNLTFNCNLCCEYCFVHDKTHERMSLATAKKAVDLLMERAAYPVVNITLIGGEPLLEFNLIKQIVPYAVETAQKRGLVIGWSVTTNGTLVTEEILEFFARHRINMLLSIDGGPEDHDRYRKTRNGEGTWHKIAGLIPVIKRYQPWLGARMTVSTGAIGNMRGNFRLLVEMGINQFIIAPAQGARCWGKEEIRQYGKKLVEILVDYQMMRQMGYPLFIEEFEKDEYEYTGWGCRAGNTSLAVAPNGDVSPCSKMLGLKEEEGKYIVGNVHSNIDVARLEPFRNPIARRQPDCMHCPRQCTGGCYAVNFEQTGDHFKPSGENCLFWVVCQETKRMAGWLRGEGTACAGCRP
ncbi:MAG: radical SAM protein [Firmicutes bacterium]|nr:radical SAM protein [Bacillota bacterium]